jgi:hypothetical protein
MNDEVFESDAITKSRLAILLLPVAWSYGADLVGLFFFLALSSLLLFSSRLSHFLHVALGPDPIQEEHYRLYGALLSIWWCWHCCRRSRFPE